VDQGPVDALQGRNRARFLHEAGVELMTSLQSKEPDDVMTTGLADLDDVLGGYYVGDLVIGAGRPSMGKSTFVTSTMMRSARHGAVLLFTLEMSAESVTARCASDISYKPSDGIAYARMMPGKRRGLSGHELERIAVATDLFQSFPVVIDERGGLSVAQIRARATREAQRLSVKGHRLRLVIVDHLGLVNAGDRSSGNRAVDLGEMTSAFKAMAKDLGVTVLLLSQLNRGVEQRDDKVPKLSDLRDSGRIEEDADSIFTFYREAYYLSRETGGSTDEALAREDQLRAVANDLDIHVVKNRHGRIGTVKAWVDMACAAVRDYPRPGEHERRE
ncbi:MAG: DnaB-like helicase C-terminal domain-containing protein, partial [Pseudomonadota bacterium]